MRVPPVPGMLGEDRLCSPRPGGHLLGAGQMTPRHPGQGCSHVGPWHCWPWGQEELSRPKGHSPTRLSHKRGDLRLSRPRVRLTPGPRRSGLAQGALATRGARSDLGLEAAASHLARPRRPLLEEDLAPGGAGPAAGLRSPTGWSLGSTPGSASSEEERDTQSFCGKQGPWGTSCIRPLPAGSPRLRANGPPGRPHRRAGHGGKPVAGPHPGRPPQGKFGAPGFGRVFGWGLGVH